MALWKAKSEMALPAMTSALHILNEGFWGSSCGLFHCVKFLSCVVQIICGSSIIE
jgi:hypothetical protein